jgi:peptidoglycan/LPS O-acetylase OafA/YrhL
MKKMHASGVITDIEVLRAVAILVTVFSHFGDLFPWGNGFYQFANKYFAFWGGVDLFFVISGFVIAKRLIRHLSDANTLGQFWRNTKAFWIRRLFRIVPSAWFWLLTTYLLSITFNTSGTFRTVDANLGDAIAGILQVANFRHYLQFKDALPWGGNSVFWSLSLEEQFYFFLPVIFLLTGRNFLKVVFVVVLVQLLIPRAQGGFSGR